uniref:Uncharacterized protein n=1 Tax=Oryza glumipatula TaxID=40148 RepID=A0A0D9ZGX2_9ORYZ
MAVAHREGAGRAVHVEEERQLADANGVLGGTHMSKARNVLVATGLLAFAGAGLAFPFYFVKSKNKPIIDSSKPLPPQATFRGPYVNTGSRDIGPDYTDYPKK